MVRNVIIYAAASAALAAALPAVSHAQSAQYDGYCYVRSADMKRDSSTARCLKGEYYAYTDGFKAAPRAPAGYVVEYFTRRPVRTLYSQVYNASTLTQNFEPGAHSNFGNHQSAAGAYADNSTAYGGTAYSGQTYTGQASGTPAYGSQTYGSQTYATPSYGTPGNTYGSGAAPSQGYAYNTSDTYNGSGGDNGSGNSSSAYGRDNTYGDEQPGSIASSGYGDEQRLSDDDRAVTGWRDDSGHWHVDAPAAIGWRDRNGQWHVGQVSAYGWRDSDGSWHEQTRDDAYGQSDRPAYTPGYSPSGY